MFGKWGFIIIAVALLLWNIMGDIAFLMQINMDTGQLAKSDPYTASIFEAMPSWVWAAYGIAVFGATLGSIALLMKRKLAVPLYILSLVAVVVQFSYSFLGTDLIAVKGWSATLFPIMIVAIAVLALCYAWAARKRGVLK